MRQGGKNERGRDSGNRAWCFEPRRRSCHGNRSTTFRIDGKGIQRRHFLRHQSAFCRRTSHRGYMGLSCKQRTGEEGFNHIRACIVKRHANLNAEIPHRNLGVIILVLAIQHVATNLLHHLFEQQSLNFALVPSYHHILKTTLEHLLILLFRLIQLPHYFHQKLDL